MLVWKLVSGGTLMRRGHGRKVMAAVMRGDGDRSMAPREATEEVWDKHTPITVMRTVMKALSPHDSPGN